MARKRKRPGVILSTHRRHERKGAKCRRVKSALTGAMIPATKDGEPGGRRPKNYGHGPGGWAKKRHEAASKLRGAMRKAGLGHLVDPEAE